MWDCEFGCEWRREFRMIYREPGFLAVVWFGSSLHLLPSLSCLFSQPSCVSPVELAEGRGGGGGGGAKTYDDEKAWSSINHWTLSGWSRFKRLLNSVGLLYFFLFYLGEQAMWKPVSSQRLLVYIWIWKIAKVYDGCVIKESKEGI